jgi:DNA repair ATPase RecN
MTYMADTLEQIAEQIMRDHGHCDLYACCGHCREHEAAILSALQSLAREREDLLKHQARTTAAWQKAEQRVDRLQKKCARYATDLYDMQSRAEQAEAALVTLREAHGKEKAPWACSEPGCDAPGVQWGKCWTHAVDGTEIE